jgi:RNA polymerase sigma-70 factor (ECF subfamily)
MSQSELTDTELLERIRQKDDQEAFTLLFRRYWFSLYQTVLNKTGDDGQAQDMVQEIFVHLWENRQSITILSSFKQYLGGMIRNRVFDYYKRSRRHNEQLLQLSRYLEQADTDYSRENIRNRGQQEDNFDRAVDSLPERIREIYLLRTRDRYSYEKIAEKLNIKQQTARNAYSRAITLLYENTGNMAFTLVLLYFL